MSGRLRRSARAASRHLSEKEAKVKKIEFSLATLTGTPVPLLIMCKYPIVWQEQNEDQVEKLNRTSTSNNRMGEKCDQSNFDHGMVHGAIVVGGWFEYFRNCCAPGTTE